MLIFMYEIHFNIMHLMIAVLLACTLANDGAFSLKDK